MTIDDIIAQTIKIEGGYTNNPADAGGPTKYGITQRTLSTWLGRQATIEDVQNLDMVTAIAIYKKMYFYDPGFDKLPSALQPQLFDIAVNSGPRKAIELLQEALGCTADGIIGPNTISLCQQSTPGLVNQVEKLREQLYLQIVQGNPSQSIFLKGWLTRAKTFIIGNT